MIMITERELVYVNDIRQLKRDQIPWIRNETVRPNRKNTACQEMDRQILRWCSIL
jgi:hypothetical protein